MRKKSRSAADTSSPCSLSVDVEFRLDPERRTSVFVGDHFQAKIPDLELRNHRHLQQQMGNRSSQVMVDPRMEGKSDDEAMADLLGKIFFF